MGEGEAGVPRTCAIYITCYAKAHIESRQPYRLGQKQAHKKIRVHAYTRGFETNHIIGVSDAEKRHANAARRCRPDV